MSDFKERMQEEFDELHDKVVKLEKFLATGQTVVSDDYMVLMHQQLSVMKNYETILLKRLEMV